MGNVKETIRVIGHGLARALSYGVDLTPSPWVTRFWKRVYWYSLERRFYQVGDNSYIEYPAVTSGERYITLGRNFQAFARLRLEAFDRHLGSIFHPEITIGDNVSMNYDCHIACITQIVIGNNVLMGSKVCITDHFHGEITKDALAIPPPLRKLVSKGPVTIEDNAWIGEGVVILPNVRIGQNSIVGANAVVTKDVPPNCVVGGVPARVIKRLSEDM
jgi:acetyltransferase-like isoleucine patch superfamily enzyme